MAFFHYSQNNSGGGFDYDPDRGITHHVVVEADEARMADYFAEEIGLYFDGCDKGMDCECCGDRWSSAYGDGDETPQVYGEPVTAKLTYPWGDFPKGEIVVHFRDGRIEWYN